MNYFKKYTSNTLAGSGNQYFYINEDENRVYTCRTCYKVFCPGSFNYSFLISNTIDSTFEDGSVSRKNTVIGEWKIHRMRVGVTDFCDASSMREAREYFDVTFDGYQGRTVRPGELFATDEILLSADEGNYICIEMSFSGKQLPCHEESIIPSFVLSDGEWVPSKRHPFVSMVGCDRAVKERIAFFGDSITQGIGTPVNSYRHFCSVAADMLGRDRSYWNLGLGYGRADDAASDGAWLLKARQNDTVAVCFGVNDICRGFTAEEIKQSLRKIVSLLRSSGCRVILETVPPFNYQGERIEVWNQVNTFIRGELAGEVEFVFDCAALLAKSDSEPYNALYGGHPNEIGCRLWGEAFAACIAALHKDD